MRRGVLAVVLVGCFSPKANQNIPCGDNLACPSGQSCDTTQSPPLCTSNPGGVDAPVGDPDAPIDQPVVECNVAADCTTQQPFCDLGTHTCRPCATDVECESHVCIESAGTCTANAEALYVSSATGSDANNCENENNACKTISGALGKLTTTRRTIRVANGNYSESFVFSAVGAVKISGEGATFANTTITQAVNGFGTGAHDHLIEATGATDLLVEGMKLTGGSVETVRVSGGAKVALFAARLTAATGGIDATNANTSVTLRQVAIDSHVDSGVATTGIGIGVSVTNGASLTMVRSAIDSNVQGVSMSGTVSYSIVNSFITRNSSTGVTIPATVGATHLFNFNTVADNGGAPSVNCASQQELRDSIFAGDDVVGCTAAFSLFTGPALAGATNIGNAVPGFAAAGDYHITNGSPAIDKADPNAQITQDFDGDARPGGNGYDIGADEH